MMNDNIHYFPGRPSSALGGALIKTSHHHAGPEPRGLNRVQAAEYIGVGTTLFDAMVKDGRMPHPFRVGARVIWDRQRLDAAFDALSDQDADDRNPWDEVEAA
jgi:predicted DNA-binding transcriptional regulator AlpA